MTKPNWHGVFPAVTTQFNEDESINYKSTQDQVDKIIKDGVHGIIGAGTVGENCSLGFEEKIQLMKEMKDCIKGRVPLLSGVAEYTTKLASNYVKECEKIGIDGLMVLPGMVYKSDNRETVAHFKTIADSTKLPIMIYNNPVSYGVDIEPEQFELLKDSKNIVAIKESSELVKRITDLRNLYDDRFILFSGVDDIVLESLMLGCTGWVSGISDVFPKECMQLYNYAQEKNWEKAKVMYQWLMPSLHLDTYPKLVQYIKLGQQIVGRGSEIVRAPKLKLEGEERKRIINIFETAIKNPIKI